MAKLKAYFILSVAQLISIICISTCFAQENIEKKKLFLYDDIALYPWSGFMGTNNGSSISLNLYDDQTPYDGIYNVKIETSGQEQWAGIIIQAKTENAWSLPGVDFTGVTSITFCVKGKDGGEEVRFEFMDDKYEKSVVLSNTWQQITVPFRETDDFTSVISLFAFVVANNPSITFYLDEIYFEVDRPKTAETPSLPELIKGLGYNEIDASKYDADFQKIKNVLHADYIRFWGPTDFTFNTLDKMSEYELSVFLPYWMPNGSYDSLRADYTDASLRSAICRSILNYLKFYLPHSSVPGVVLGNEVFHNLNPNSNENKIAFAQFLNELCNQIHSLFPNLKVSYAAVGDEPLDLLISHTPLLDIYGSNAYGNIASVIENYSKSSYGKPLLFFEYGCLGWWETDWATYTNEERASDYFANWNALKRKSLGGSAFLWLDKKESGYQGWGIVNTDRSYRPQFNTLARVYSPLKKSINWLFILLE